MGLEDRDEDKGLGTRDEGLGDASPKSLPGNGISNRAVDISPREWNMIGEALGIPDRQIQIMEQFIAGVRKPKDIAPILGIKVCTVKTHIRRMYKKLGVKARSDAVVLALMVVLEIRSSERRTVTRRSTNQPPTPT
jgi:DNA-binding CsgD family transcriptional regulator